ncbi:hypothetical protein EV714DRAFT_177248, partial [Schizophyllum commune]
CFCLCHSCSTEVSRSKFQRIPLRSYANGLWRGRVPAELQGLTFLEEQCIARARATRCMFKLELGPAGQFASRGNVCIFPQDPSPLLTSLPPPLSTLHDEICVILVGSPTTDISIEMLRRSPLLVRRSRIVNALLWLIENNPLYADLDVNEIMRNASDYPECDVPIPV